MTAGGSEKLLLKTKSSKKGGGANLTEKVATNIEHDFKRGKGR